MIPELIALIIFYCMLLVDIRKHNKKVEKQWPDHSDPQQSQMNMRFQIATYGYYFFLVLLIALLIKDIFS